MSLILSERNYLKKYKSQNQQNSMVGIVGPSGAGKSTIVDLVTSILKSTKGHIFFDGKNQETLNMLEYRNILVTLLRKVFFLMIV